MQEYAEEKGAVAAYWASSPSFWYHSEALHGRRESANDWTS